MTIPALHLLPSLKALTPGAMFHQYRLLEQIGVGGQGVVWSAEDIKLKRIFAIKFNEIPESSEAEADDIREEQQLEQLVKLQHAYILPFQEFGAEGRIRFSVSPYVPGGTLTERIKAAPFSVREILAYGMKVASALDYLHSQGIIHRDLKSANILLDLSQNAYLADFGLARMVTTSTLAFHTGHGTPPYAPPEQIQLKAITPKSDLYSFGILLYEMFTGQLPWNGKKQLGMEQTHSQAEIPDPREFNEALHPVVTDVLRQATSANPQARPNSAGEIMRTLYQILRVPMEPLPNAPLQDQHTNRNNAEILLKNGLERWNATNGTYNLGLTKFALIDLEREKINMDPYKLFMLSQALTYDYNDDQWWQMVQNPRDRLQVSSILLRKNNEVIAVRLVEHFLDDPRIRSLTKGLPESLASNLLAIGTKSENVFLRQQIFEGLRKLIRSGSNWTDSPNYIIHMARLGELALEDSEVGDTTAELIGHLHSPTAVQVILDSPDDDRKIDALLLIQKAAGSLPQSVQGNIRLKLALDWIIFRLVQQPVSLISTYMFTFISAALAVGIQVYMTYNLPNFLDTARFTTSLEQGLIIGAIFGLGIFTTRVIVERFNNSNAFLRVVLGTIAGGLGMNIGMLVFHILFINTPPKGLSITVACMLIGFTFAVGGLFRYRIIRMILSTVAILISIVMTWWIHLNFAASAVDLTPVFRYDYAWSMTQVSLTALAAALLIGIFGNLGNLTLTDE